MKASGDIVLPPSPTGPFILDSWHCCLRKSDGSYHQCQDMPGTEADARARCAAIGTRNAALGIIATLEAGSCANSLCNPPVNPTSPLPTPNCPAVPPNVINDCARESNDQLRCLLAMKDKPSYQATVGKLIKIIQAWGSDRCPMAKTLCYHAEQGNTCYPGLNLAQMLCRCQAYNTYWEDLKKIVLELCNGTLKPVDVDDRLKDICRKLKSNELNCGGYPADTVGGIECGMVYQ